MNRYILTIVALLIFTVAARADYIDAVDKGNEALNSGDYKTALEQYHIAEADIPNSPELSYNIGLALYEQGDYEQATERFNMAIESEAPDIASSAYFNLGNTKFKAQDYAGAVENYKRSLELNPDDMDAKYNLELARKMLKENAEKQQQDQQQQQQNQSDQQQEQQNQQQQQDQQDQQNQQNQRDQQNQQQGENAEQNPPQDSTGNSQQLQEEDKKPMSKEDAARILNAFKDDEKDVQKKIKRSRATSNYFGKDW